MFKYIDLCVDMRKGVREGLNQYRNMCQQVNVSSLEEAIKHLMHLSSEKADAVHSKADKRPEDLMLSYFSGQKEKDGSDRELWLKYSWETYRTLLQVLQNNSKLEPLYVMTAHRAFQFCKQYRRSTEFRRLGDLLRNHHPENLELCLETRFEQLKVATELELWQEAFRAVEDICGLMCKAKEQPKASLLVLYYAKLTEMFWISSSPLHHAYAWLKLFSLEKSFNKNLRLQDLQLIASSVVLAALSAPNEVESDRSLKMAKLVGFNLDNKRDLSRASLLAEMVSKGVLSCVSQEVKELFHLLEHEFVPLDLASRVQPLLAEISKVGGKLSLASSLHEVQLSQYVPALEKHAALRLLKQVSQVYQSLSIDSLSKMIPFLDLPSLVKMKCVSMKVDHLRGAVVFGTDELSDQLVTFSELLNKSRAMIYPDAEKASELVPGLSEAVEKERVRLLARKSIIENSKEEQERLLLEREKEEESNRLKLQKLAQEAEKKRIASEIEQRRNERISREIQQRELQYAQELLLAAEKRSKLKQKLESVQKQGKMMDHLERAKREEASPLIESAYQLRLVEDRILHEQEQLQEVQLSRQRHEGDLQQKKRLARMLEQKVQYHDRLMTERREKIDNMRRQKMQEIEVKRKMMLYLSTEMQRLEKLQQQEEEEAERLKKEAAERQEKLNETASPAKYVPRFKLRDSPAAAPAPAPDSSYRPPGDRRPGYGFGGWR